MEVLVYAVLFIIAVLIAIAVARYTFSVDEHLQNQNRIIDLMILNLRKSGTTDEEILSVLQTKAQKKLLAKANPKIESL